MPSLSTGTFRDPAPRLQPSRRQSVIGVVLVLVALLPGCKSSRELAVRQSIETVNEITSVLNEIANGADARKEMPRLRKLVVRLRELMYGLERLKQSPRHEKDDGIEKYRREFQDAVARFRAALDRVGRHGEAASLITEVFNQELPDFP